MLSRVSFASSLLGTFLAQGRGIAASKSSEQPEKLLELYDIENCPYCRVVREVMTYLDLDVIIYPCPKQGDRFRSIAKDLGGKQQFPFLVDPNNDTSLYESTEIIAYLMDSYGNGRVPSQLEVKWLRTPAAMAISSARLVAGIKVKPSVQPEKLLELYSFESSPYARLVREKLCETQIPYILRNVGRTQWQDYLLPGMRDCLLQEYKPDSRNRKALMERYGNVTVPYLVDPNTGEEIGESAEIIDYLHDTYMCK